MSQKIIGEPNKNIVLETAGRFYVKVGQKYYEIDFRNLDKLASKDELINTKNEIESNTTTAIEEAIENAPKQDLSDYVTIADLNKDATRYVTRQEWTDIKTRQDALENALLPDFTETISPISVNTMQMVVGSEQLQYTEITDFDDDTTSQQLLYINENDELVFRPGFIKHYTYGFETSEIRPKTTGYNGGQSEYWRWFIANSNYENTEEVLHLDPEKTYYFYLRVPVANVTMGDKNDDGSYGDNTQGGFTGDFALGANVYFDVEDTGARNLGEIVGRGKYAKTGVGDFIYTTEAMELEYVNEDFTYLYLLYAIITEGTNFTTMNGYTEISPGRITAYLFSSPDGNSYLDLKNSKFKLGNDLMFEDGSLSLKGGLLAGLVAVRDDNTGKIVAGLNGSDSAEINGEVTSLTDDDHGKIMVFAGAEDDLKNSKTIIYEDGTLKTKAGEFDDVTINGSFTSPLNVVRNWEITTEKDEDHVFYRMPRYDYGSSPTSSVHPYCWVYAYDFNGGQHSEYIYTNSEMPVVGANVYGGSVTSTVYSKIKTSKSINVFTGEGSGKRDSVIIPQLVRDSSIKTSTENPQVFGVDDFTWDISNAGRSIKIVNYEWLLGDKFEGALQIKAPEGKYFFENGYKLETLLISREYIELFGYGSVGNFYGWIVVKRTGIATRGVYGNPFNVIYQGSFNPSSEKGLDGFWTATIDLNGTGKYDLSVTKSNGTYKITLPENINYFNFKKEGTSGYIGDIDSWDVLITPKTCDKTGKTISEIVQAGYACLTERGNDATNNNKSYFVVKTADDSTLNPIGFNFLVFNTRSWIKIS